MSTTNTINLSARTKVETFKDHDDALPTLLVRRLKKSGEENRVFLDHEDCRYLTENVVKIEDTIDTVASKKDGEESVKIPLTKGWVVEVTKYQDNVYCGIFATYPDGHIRRHCGMNFGMAEWAELHPFLTKTFSTSDDDLDTASPPRAKRPRVDNTDTRGQYTVTKFVKYSWKWVKDGQVLQKASKWFDSDKSCMDNALVNRPDVTGVYVEMESAHAAFLCTKLFVEHMYMFLLEQKIRNQQNDCEACKADYPAQRDHLEGCLMPWDEVVDTHLVNLQLLVTKGDILQLYHKILTYVGRPCHTYLSELDHIANFQFPDDLISKMKQMSIEYYELFETCYAM